MSRKNRYNEKEFKDAVAKCFSIAQVLQTFNLNVSGGNYKHFAKCVKEWTVDTKHFTGQGHLRNKKHDQAPRKKLEDILVENSSYTSTNALRIRLLKSNILKSECSICKITTWMDKPISFHLDHINGINTDNRIENLQILCPNCHSQTDTYCGRNMKVPKRFIEKFNLDTTLGPAEQRKQLNEILQAANDSKIPIENKILLNREDRAKSICEECKGPKLIESKVCKVCYDKDRNKHQTPYNRNKVVHPSKEELQKLLWEQPTTKIAASFGVCDNAVAKWAKKYGCTKPERGYWAKIAAEKY